MIRYLRAANVKDGTLELDDVKTMNFTPAEQAIFTLKHGDVLVTEGSGSLTAVGASAVWREEIPGTVCFQNTLLRMRPRSGVDGRFLGWWARSAFANGEFASVASGANIYHLSAERVRSLPITLPSLDEQRRIADFLDAETARIDRLTLQVTTASRLAAERRQAFIEQRLHRSETRRIRLKFLLQEPLAYGASEAAVSEDRHWPRYIRITDITPTGGLREESFKSLSPSLAQPYLLRDGDLLFARSGATVGKTFLYRAEHGPACFAGYLIRARFPRIALIARIVAYFTQTADYWQQVAGDTIQATIQNVSAERYADILVPEVPREEHPELLHELDERDLAHHKFRTAAEHQVSLLAERKQALITAAVTGQIDVTTARGVDVS